MTPVQIGLATLYCGDAREVLPTLAPVDAVVTDPPYGVGLIGKRTKHKTSEANESYSELTVDEVSVFDRVIYPCLFGGAASWARAVITPGIRLMWRYPEPADTGCAYFPAGAGLGRWGFVGFHPILYYGKCPYLAAGQGHRPSSLEVVGIAGKASDDRHPVAKPLRWVDFMVRKASASIDDVILDPFMGSGTTGVSAVKAGRQFIGVEIDPEYFDVACERIDMAQRQADLFAVR